MHIADKFSLELDETTDVIGKFQFFLVGWDLRHQVLRPLLAYCTAPDDR
jgi:hypothetical protein